MDDDRPAGQEEAEVEEERTVETETSETDSSEAVLDVESVEEREESVEELRQRIREQSEQIDELEDVLLDLSTRVADGDGTGVCPECHGPVVKRNPWFRRARIQCTQCGEVFHEY